MRKREKRVRSLRMAPACAHSPATRRHGPAARGGWSARRRGSGALARLCACSALALVSLLAGETADALASEPPRTETPIRSSAPDAARVSESYVSLYEPLPAEDGPRPAACDRIGYLRFRDAHGPANPADADAIFVAQPGIFEGAGALDQVARNTIAAAAEKGYDVEFWALNRRSNCLTETFGDEAAAAAHDPRLALGYYYEGKRLDGRTFPGWVSESEAGFLAHVGLAQTVQDEYAVISQLPPAVRRSKVFCGGHSLGGIITGAFADWDFSGEGNPEDAGYNQCAGWFALDTRFTLSLGREVLSQSLGGAPGEATGAGIPVSASVLRAAQQGGEPYLDLPPFTPETFAALPILGMAGYYEPRSESTLEREFPENANFEATYRLFFANGWLNFLDGLPSIRQFHVSNEAAVGFLFDDDSQPIGILRSSVGAPSGGPVIEKNFPLPYGSPPALAGLLGGNKLISPAPWEARPSGAHYGWLNYDEVPAPGPSPVGAPGQPYTSPASEVSDVSQLARALFQGAPAMFTEDYFPSKLVTDIVAAGSGDRSGSLASLRYEGVTQRPAAYVDAGEGITPDLGAAGEIPTGPEPQVHVVAGGYNHLDVVTAAYRQTDGEPELTSHTLASWMSEIVGPPAP